MIAALDLRRSVFALSLTVALVATGCRTASPPSDAPAVVAEPGQAAPPPTNAWRPIDLQTRGSWRVTRQTDGTYRVVTVLDAAPTLILAVGETREEQDWEAWVNAGFPAATRRISLVVDPASGDVTRSFHYGEKSIRDGGLKGVLLGPPAPESGAPLRNHQDLLAGDEIAVGAGAFPAVPLPRDFRGESYNPWIGVMGTKQEFKAEDGLPVSVGFSLFAVGALGAADAAGIEVGDVIISLSPLARDTAAVGDFYVSVAHRYRVGDEVTIEWLRQDGDEVKEMSATVTIPAYPIDRSGATRPPAEWEAAAKTPEAALLEKLAARHGHTADYADFTSRLRALNTDMDPYRLPEVMAAHEWPFATEPMMRQASTRLQAAANTSPAAMLWLTAGHLGVVPSEVELELPDYRDADLKGHLDYLAAILEQAAIWNEKAFAGLTEEERAFVLAAAEDYMEAFVQAHMMIYAKLPQQRDSIRVLQLGARVDLDALIMQARILALATEPAFLASLKAVMEANTKPGRIGHRATPHGQIVLSGTADDRHRGDVAILVDLGGDDVYSNNTGGSVPSKIPSALVIDFAGNDRYENWRLGAQGAGVLGAGILLDVAGDDTYIVRRGGQGFGFFGVGMLVDRAGTDTLRSMDYAQGVGQFGVGVLVLDGGANRLESHTASQGVGFTRGVGLLLGGTGDDSYYCKGQYASGYRDAGSFEGWGQGLGTGHRPYASGGIGMLIDRGGADVYEGGSFAGGGGYYFGLGMLHDLAGDDEYRGSRYNAGFTAHQAVGVFLEDGGNDRYWQMVSVSAGMSWDESVTVFVDAAGDDRYDCPGFGFGASAMTGFALFKDLDGSDVYERARPGNVSGNSYHGGTSIGYFLDLGAGTDTMPAARDGQVIAVDQDVAYFVHAPDIAAANRAADEPLPTADPAPTE